MFLSSSVSKWSLLIACTGMLSACGGNTPPDGATNSNAPSAATTSSPYQPTATFQEVMDAAVDPTSDFIWNAVSTSQDATGVHENQPRTAEEWHTFRRNALLLAEAANLIAVPGRHVANGDKTIKDTQPLDVAQIQQRLDANREALLGFAGAMREVAMKLVAAADQKDVAAITDLGGTLDEVCESCHKVFWYPE